MKYRSAKGRPIDWQALSGASVPVAQRELQRPVAAPAKPAQRVRGMHIPAEAVEEVVEDVKPSKRKKVAEETPETEAGE